MWRCFGGCQGGAAEPGPDWGGANGDPGIVKPHSAGSAAAAGKLPPAAGRASLSESAAAAPRQGSNGCAAAPHGAAPQPPPPPPPAAGAPPASGLAVLGSPDLPISQALQQLLDSAGHQTADSSSTSNPPSSSGAAMADSPLFAAGGSQYFLSAKPPLLDDDAACRARSMPANPGDPSPPALTFLAAATALGVPGSPWQHGQGPAIHQTSSLTLPSTSSTYSLTRHKSDMSPPGWRVGHTTPSRMSLGSTQEGPMSPSQLPSIQTQRMGGGGDRPPALQMDRSGASVYSSGGFSRVRSGRRQGAGSSEVLPSASGELELEWPSPRPTHSSNRVELVRQSLEYDSFDMAPSEYGDQALSAHGVADLVNLLNGARRDLQGTEVTVDKVLAHGSCGPVYSGEWRNVAVAVKAVIIKDIAVTDAATRKREHDILMTSLNQSLMHPNVVTTHTIILRVTNTTPTIPPTINLMPGDIRLYLVQELCDSGTLAEAIDGEWLLGGPHRRPDMRSIVSTAVDVACGLAHVHSHNIVLGNLGPHNVLLQVHTKAVWSRIAKVTDWGVLKLLADSSASGSAFDGRTSYVAPEVLVLGQATSRASDVYAFGVILWEMFTGKPSWRFFKSGSSGRAKSPVQPQSFAFSEDCPAVYADLASECLLADPLARPTCFSLVQRLLAYQQFLHSDLDTIYIHAMGTIKLERRTSRAASGAETLRTWRMEGSKSTPQRRFSTGSFVAWPFPQAAVPGAAAGGGGAEGGAGEAAGSGSAAGSTGNSTSQTDVVDAAAAARARKQHMSC